MRLAVTRYTPFLLKTVSKQHYTQARKVQGKHTL